MTRKEGRENIFVLERQQKAPHSSMPCVRVMSQGTLRGHPHSVFLLTWRLQVRTVPSICWRHSYMCGL